MHVHITIIQEIQLLHTLADEIFGVGDFWLEIRVIIKILSHP